MILVYQDYAVLAKGTLDFLVGDRGHRDKVYGEHQSFQGLGDLGRVRPGADDLALEGGDVADLEKGVDIADVDLP